MLRGLKKRAERALQFLVLRTSFPPFAWLYAAYYSLAVHVAVWSLSRLPAVSSIYLTGGLALGKVTFGLSDIDLMIFVRGDESAVRRRWGWLRMAFPILPANEVGVFNLEGFDDLLADDPHLRYRLTVGAHRLLFGPPVCQAPPKDGPRDFEALFGRLDFCWHLLVTKIINARPEVPKHERYLCEKLIRHFDLEGHVGSQPAFPNPTAVFELGTRQMKALAKTHGWPQNPSRPGSPQQVDIDNVHLSVGAASERKVSQFVDLIIRQHSDLIASVLLGPRQVFPIAESQLGIYLIEKRPLGLADVQTLIAELGRLAPNGVSLHLLTEDVSLCLTPMGLSESIACPLTHPATFAYLSSKRSVLYGAPLPISRDRVLATLTAALPRQRIKLTREIRRQVDLAHVVRHAPLAFQEHIWQALQLKAQETFGILPLTSLQVCHAWAGERDCGWLTSLHHEYRKDLDGLPSETERFYQRGTPLLRRLFDCA